MGHYRIKAYVGPRQYLQLRRPRVNRQVPARIIGQVGIHPEGNVYGMAFTGGAVDFLGIQFPPQADAGTKQKQVWLQCNACGAVQDVKLDELETFVLKANDALGHPCSLCNDWTLWGKIDGKENVKPGHIASVSVPAALPTGGERRKHRRVQLQRITAVRHPLLAEEIVSTTNISRGGLRFLSPREYQPNEWIEIALFYQPGGHNTYAPGRIVWQATDGDLRAYGLQYVRS